MGSQLLGTIIIIAGLALIFLKFAVDNGWIKPSGPITENINPIAELIKLLVKLAETQPIMVIGVVLVMLGIFIYFGPEAFRDLFASSSTPTPTPEITSTP